MNCSVRLVCVMAAEHLHAELAAVPLKPTHELHPEWNYSILQAPP